MKAKHNKKRNTAFLFEVLVRELTKGVVSHDTSRAAEIKGILKEYFSKGDALAQELDCYRALDQEEPLDKYTAEKLIFRAKTAYDALDKEEIFTEQSAVIQKINKTLGKNIYKNFVPNYKSYATVAQLFSSALPLKNRVLVEQKILDSLTAEPNVEPSMKSVDSLVVKNFVSKFNEGYKDLLPRQRTLLESYVVSFDENLADFRLLVAEELRSIRSDVTHSLTLEEVRTDPEMVTNTEKVLESMENLNIACLTEADLLKILKLQKLVSEYSKDAD